LGFLARRSPLNGAFYAMPSLGLAVIFGMLNIINFAHGSLFMMKNEGRRARHPQRRDHAASTNQSAECDDRAGVRRP
jgi:hypothetical protein